MTYKYSLSACNLSFNFMYGIFHCTQFKFVQELPISLLRLLGSFTQEVLLHPEKIKMFSRFSKVYSQLLLLSLIL